jgi:hypothetical protein
VVCVDPWQRVSPVPVRQRIWFFFRVGKTELQETVAPLTFVSQAGSLVTRRVLVADATFKRPKDFLELQETSDWTRSNIIPFAEEELLTKDVIFVIIISMEIVRDDIVCQNGLKMETENS